MTLDDLDRILSSDDSPEPSAAFVAKVMAAVRRDEAEPAPLKFPWFRFAAGAAAAGVTAASAALILVRNGLPSKVIAVLSSPLDELAPAMTCAAALLILSLTIGLIPRILLDQDY